MSNDKQHVSDLAHGVAIGVTVALERNRKSWLWTLAFGFGVLLLISLAADWMRYGYDSTDGEDRSGMALHVDAMTGCHYLSASGGGITPRLNRNGGHICD